MGYFGYDASQHARDGVFSFGVGLAAVIVSLQIYRRYRLGFLGAHLAVVSCFNLMVFPNITFSILILPDASLSDGFKAAVFTGFQLTMLLLQLYAASFFLQLTRELVGETVKARTRTAAAAAILLCSVLQTLALAAPKRTPGFLEPRIVGRFICYLALGVVSVVLLAAIRRAGRIAEERSRTAVSAYRPLVLILMSFVIALVILQHSGGVTMTNCNLLAAFLIVVMNAAPIVSLGWFADKFHGIPRIEWMGGPDSARFFGQYDITSREQEIIRLVCSGRLNEEIAQKLLISLQTVKDHVHRIFRKTGVTNRVQLANVFLSEPRRSEEDTNRNTGA